MIFVSQQSTGYRLNFLLQAGPSNPHKTQQMAAEKNTLSGYAEAAQVNDFQFEKERRTFDSFGQFFSSDSVKSDS